MFYTHEKLIFLKKRYFFMSLFSSQTLKLCHSRPSMMLHHLIHHMSWLDKPSLSMRSISSPPTQSVLFVCVSSFCFLDYNTILPQLSASKSTHLESPSASQSSLKTWPNAFTFMMCWISLNRWSLQLLIFISFSNFLISA